MYISCTLQLVASLKQINLFLENLLLLKMMHNLSNNLSNKLYCRMECVNYEKHHYILMKNKDIQKYQEIWECLLFIHILLTKIYRSKKRRFFIHTLFIQKLTKYSYTYHTKYFALKERIQYEKQPQKIGCKIKCHIKNDMKWAVFAFQIMH